MSFIGFISMAIFWILYLVIYVASLFWANSQNKIYLNIDERERHQFQIWTELLPINIRNETFNVKYSLMKIVILTLIIGNGQFIEVIQLYITQQYLQWDESILIYLLIETIANCVILHIYLIFFFICNKFGQIVFLKRRNVNRILIGMLQKDSRYWALYSLCLNLSFACITSYGYHMLDFAQTFYHFIIGLIISVLTLIIELIIYKFQITRRFSIYRLYLKQNLEKQEKHNSSTQRNSKEMMIQANEVEMQENNNNMQLNYNIKVKHNNLKINMN